MVFLKNRVNDLEAPKRYGGSKDYDSMDTSINTNRDNNLKIVVLDEYYKV